jgi:hypothetical protein
LVLGVGGGPIEAGGSTKNPCSEYKEHPVPHVAFTPENRLAANKTAKSEAEF